MTTPEAVAARANATWTKSEVVYRRAMYVCFWAIYTTPEGEVADRVYTFSDCPAGDRVVTPKDEPCPFCEVLLEPWRFRFAAVATAKDIAAATVNNPDLTPEHAILHIPESY